MVCEKMLFLFLLGTFVTVLFCHFPFDCTFSGYSTQWSVGIEGLEVWNVSVGGARGPAEPAGCLDWWETFLVGFWVQPRRNTKRVHTTHTRVKTPKSMSWNNISLKVDGRSQL